MVDTKAQKSNIVAVSVCPGISRVDTFQNSPVSLIYIAARYVLIMRRYAIFQPVLRIFFKCPEMAMQFVLHALFLPTPFKVLVQPTQAPDAMPEEVLKPGALYR